MTFIMLTIFYCREDRAYCHKSQIHKLHKVLNMCIRIIGKHNRTTNINFLHWYPLCLNWMKTSSFYPLILTSLQDNCLCCQIDQNSVNTRKKPRDIIFPRREPIRRREHKSIDRVLEMGRYTTPELIFVPEFPIGTYKYIGAGLAQAV
jgi:hypothetical protein